MIPAGEPALIIQEARPCQGRASCRVCRGYGRGMGCRSVWGVAAGLWAAAEIIEAVAARCLVKGATREAVVVLPGFRNENPARINRINRWRAGVALRTARHLGPGTRIIASGGDPAGVGVAEADLLAAELRRRGFTGEIITETQSRTTWENARRVLPLLGSASCIAVASNPLHGLKLRLHLAALEPGLRQRFVAAQDYRPLELGPLRVLSTVIGVGDLLRLLRDKHRDRCGRETPGFTSRVLGGGLARWFG